MAGVTYASYIVMDLEMNDSGTRFVSEKNGIRMGSEIVEIGAVKLDREMNETGRYQAFVRPTAYPKIDSEVNKLTGITTEQIWSGRPFPEAAADFLAWCGDDAAFITWSENDIIVFEDNMMYHGMDPDTLPPCYDIQMMFDDQVTMDGRDFALTYAIWKLGITPAPPHDALNDAVNTAEVLKRLDLSDGLDEYEV